MECLDSRFKPGHEWKSAAPSWRAASGGKKQVCAGDEWMRAPPPAANQPPRAAPTTDRGHDRPPPPPAPRGHAPPPEHHHDLIMSDMDEISYWVYTKRAPCLMNYDNIIKKEHEAAQTAKSLKVIERLPSPKKKKRKLSLLLDDDCVSVEKQQNLYFETSQQKQHTAPSSCKSGTPESDIDFNIKNSPVNGKLKTTKKQKCSQTLSKNNKIITSTPLRRSQRKLHNDSCNSQLLNSFVSYNCSIPHKKNSTIQDNCKIDTKEQSKRPVRNRSLQKNCVVVPGQSNNTNVPIKEQFEDESDVSGFTANYIRSTKLQHNSNHKPHQGLRSRTNRNLVKESQATIKKDGPIPTQHTTIVCVNKSMNTTTELPNTTMLNCSTDSSQNIINLVTSKDNTDQRINKSTSLLKFVDLKTRKSKEREVNLKSDKQGPSDLDESSPTKSTGNSRYPKRHKKNTELVSSGMMTRSFLGKTKESNKDHLERDLKRQQEQDTNTLKTRSRKSSNLAYQRTENPSTGRQWLSNSTDMPSTMNTHNVAVLPADTSNKSGCKFKNSHMYAAHLKVSLDTSVSALQRDSVRERSGFAACFSDSDDDSDTLKQRKFFC